MDNAALQQKYEEMHRQGVGAWFDSGRLERELIYNMGKLWDKKCVLEVGCGEGELLQMLFVAGADILGMDYSETAISTAKTRYPGIADRFRARAFREQPGMTPELVVMQGVMEHFDHPFSDLAWMMDTWRPKTVITTSPGFLNVRGIVWHTLAAMGAVVSKTDLHYLNPWQFEWFCHCRGYKLTMASCDDSWAEGIKMAEDLRKRIPLALKDGGLPAIKDLDGFIEWLMRCGEVLPPYKLGGATICYRIDR